MIAKFGKKKQETLGYFSLTDSMVLSSSVLELLTSESPIFQFRTFWGHRHQGGFRLWGTSLHQVSGHDSPIINRVAAVCWWSLTPCAIMCGHLAVCISHTSVGDYRTCVDCKWLNFADPQTYGNVGENFIFVRMLRMSEKLRLIWMLWQGHYTPLLLK